MVLTLFFSIILFCCISPDIGDIGDIGSIGGINIIPHTATFVTNGGTEVEQITTTKIENEPSTEKENYLFDGWFLDTHFMNLAIFPYKLEDNVTFYAKWVKISDELRFEKGSIKFMNTKYSGSVSYDITPQVFDYDRLFELQKNGIRITIQYNVYLKKDYNVPFDIGYAGSPKYEVYVTDSSSNGYANEDLPITTTSESKVISCDFSLDYLKNNRFTLTFSTNNIQNIICFENIIISYECL